MDSEILSTKRFFQSHHIILSDEWLESCIQWYHEENPDSNYTTETLHLKVYEQWLILDLRDVEVPVLPQNISGQRKGMLNGNFSLQITQIVDISRPKLWQIQKLRNQSFLNRTTLDYENEMNNCGKRMLQLKLTDGTQEVEAIEYKPISTLHVNMSPGIKLKIVGQVAIRRGQLMLEEKNVIVLGGEVEEILISNAAENILARALNLPQNPNPNCIEESDTNVQNNNRSNSVNSVQYNNQNCNINNRNGRDAPHVRNTKNLIVESNCNPSTSNININDRVEEEDSLILRHVDELLEAERDVLEIQARPRIAASTVCENNSLNISPLDDIDKSIFEEMDIDAHLDFIDEQIKHNEQNNKRVVLINEIKGMDRDSLLNKTFIIKAKFKAIVQKLTLTDNMWFLKLLVEDNTDDIEVSIHSDIITHLIGVSPSEMSALKTDILNKNQSATTAAMKAIEGLRAKIMELNCFMRLVLVQNEKCLTVTDLKDTY